jgi:hypothetical protein
MPPPLREPIGLQPVRTTKLVSRAFDDALAEAGGSLPTWLLLLSPKAQRRTGVTADEVTVLSDLLSDLRGRLRLDVADVHADVLDLGHRP